MQQSGAEVDMGDINHQWWNTLEIDLHLVSKPRTSDRIPNIQSIQLTLIYFHIKEQ